MKVDDVAACWEANAEAWTRLSRAGYDVYRDALNTPAFLALLPDVTGLGGLDIGCGEGSNTRRVAALGAFMSAIDIAPTFIRHARATEADDPLGIDYHVGDGAALPFADATFDFATAFMSMMDMPDPAAALAAASRVLKAGGFLQFSILHPCFVAPQRRNIRDAAGRSVAVEVADYYRETNGEPDVWMFSTVPAVERERTPPFHTPRFHRTLSCWVDIIGRAGLVIEALAEPRASEALAAAEPVVADTRVAPIFLHIRARKAAETQTQLRAS